MAKKTSLFKCFCKLHCLSYSPPIEWDLNPLYYAHFLIYMVTIEEKESIFPC